MKLAKLVFLTMLVLMTAQVRAEEPPAVLNGVPVTNEEVDKLAKNRMMKILSQMYDIKRDAIEQIIDERLLEAEAKKQGKTVSDVIKSVQAKAAKVTEEDVKMVYELQKKNFGDKTFEEVKTRLMAQLDGQKKQAAVSEFIDSLRSKADFKINLDRPRAQVSVDDDPSKGKKGAPITLIEFSEYQCPFCKKTRPTIDKILSTYGDKVHYVFRDFPLSFHNQAKDAANAAHCAGDQGKYWEYSDKLWESQGQHSQAKLKEIATGLKLDMTAFEKCAKDGKYYAEINKDAEDGANAGVSGTPAYFVNGLFLSGAQPFEAFKQLIDEELAGK